MEKDNLQVIKIKRKYTKEVRAHYIKLDIKVQVNPLISNKSHSIIAPKKLIDLFEHTIKEISLKHLTFL